MSFTNYLEQKVLAHVFGGAAYAPPTLFVGLFNAAPGQAGGGREVTGGAYRRMQIGAMTVTAGDPSTAVSSATFEFPVATSDWGEITHAGIFDAASGGNLLDYAPLSQAKTVYNGDAFRFVAGQLKINLTNLD